MSIRHVKPHAWTLANTAVVAALTCLAMLGTLVIRVPIPATTGYFNIGDVFVILAGLWLGPVSGLIVGAIGPTLADAIGFPQFIPATFVVKGFEGLIVGLIGGGQREIRVWRRVVAAFSGGASVVVGYFLFEAYIYPSVGRTIPFFNVTDVGAAIVELFPNTIQGIVGAIVGLGLWRTVSGSLPPREMTQDGHVAQQIGEPDSPITRSLR